MPCHCVSWKCTESKTLNDWQLFILRTLFYSLCMKVTYSPSINLAFLYSVALHEICLLEMEDPAHSRDSYRSCLVYVQLLLGAFQAVAVAVDGTKSRGGDRSDGGGSGGGDDDAGAAEGAGRCNAPTVRGGGGSPFGGDGRESACADVSFIFFVSI